METPDLTPFRTLRSELQVGLAAGDAQRCRAVADELHRQVLDARDRNDRARLAQLGGQTARLRSLVKQDGDNPALECDLRRIARTAETEWTTQVMRRPAPAPVTPEKFTVRELVLSQLRTGPKRPRDIARELDLDRTQVSRALRQLKRAGLVAHVDTPATSADQRASLWMTA